jgi:hypothetical protein
MYVGRDFHPSDVGESEVYTFDFVKDLADGDIIVEATWHCTVAADSEVADAAAADHVALPATFEGTKTMQQVSGLVDGVKYVLQAVIGSEQGETKSLWSHVKCGTPA